MAVHQFPPFSAPQVVVEARVQVAALADLSWVSRSDDELVGVVEELQRLRATLAAVEAGAVAEVEARGTAKTLLHFGSTADWLTHVGGLHRGEGRRVVTRALALSGPLAATSTALADGAVSPEQADVVVSAIEALPGGLAVRRRGEETLLEDARSLDATALAKVGRHLVHVVDPDRSERRLEAQLARDERAAHLGRHLSIVDDGAGGVRLKGYGSIEDGATLRAALLPLTAPAPAVDAETGEDVADPRDHGARLWDALVRTAQTALDSAVAPESHGVRPRVTVTISQAALHDDLAGHGLTDDGLDLPAGVVRRLACDADLLPVVLGGRSEVLDVGHRHRLVSAAIWQALVIRDRHCAFPGCTRPPVMCHAHHIVHWVDHGRTSLDNLALLCGHHHRVIHDTAWEIRLNSSDRRPEFRAPSKAGRYPGWIRQRYRRE